jgi:hypothetical protein
MVLFNDKRVEALHIRPVAPRAKEESKIEIGLAKRDRPAIGEPVEATDTERDPPQPHRLVGRRSTRKATRVLPLLAAQPLDQSFPYLVEPSGRRRLFPPRRCPSDWSGWKVRRVLMPGLIHRFDDISFR